jgi:hypothetical protein
LAPETATEQALGAIASTLVILIIFVAIGMWAVRGIWSTDIVVAKTDRFNVCVNDAIHRSPGFAAYTDLIGNSSTVVFVHTPLARVGIKVIRLSDATVQIEGYGTVLMRFVICAVPFLLFAYIFLPRLVELVHADPSGP